ncbi:proline racemase [Virgibacillus pantothenticus]|uniref:Proline racemase n=1 Tax=Virgibacillus pantothenticus TaxID=1473 RepID=A0A0L0QU35_VIRPA|nr:proline racemase family protein [Virgibacillus pantothenticus]KNE22071.1 proline racemase [Virgibacillus pantothenticus]MBU8566703.1 proline racemase family protein [Virgibacillus pantothenticus]MBU8600286.1 proline racemase family protein [Virgibacillus pantothenticus]MBU8634859.1 proline racemase family protein [Virgibacillus pantothenticus]MBU8642423.1 proline racemase family protein [Virgibacillus pantothenticus]
MKYNKLFTTIDTHTGGNPTRTVLTGLPNLNGNTMSEKMLDMKENHDWIRKFLMNEPRGHDVMSGALMVTPCHPDADVGVIFMETGGYLPMCGHDTIGFCTALIEAGMVEVLEPYTCIHLDTPAGLVKTKVKVTDGKAIEVTFTNVPSFLFTTIEIDVEGIGKVHCDIAYGGNFYGIIDARQLDISLTTDNASQIIEHAITIRNKINANVQVVHPLYPFIKGLTHIEFFTAPVNPKADLKNTVIVPPGGIDRSPCGTGTSAKLATMFRQQEIGVKEPFIYESIVGTLFQARILEETKVDEYIAVIPEVTGSAWVMGIHRFFYKEHDPLNEGFLLIPPMEAHD